MWKSSGFPYLVYWLLMGSFGEDLRMERLSRGIALDQIAAITKISQRHLVALEQDKFRLLPGGILNKGIVRGYTGALGLDQHDWTERFLRAYLASGEGIDDDRSWTTFASNVGKARMMHRDAVEIRLRWIGAILLLLVVGAGGYLTLRYLGFRAGWWSTLMPPMEKASATVHAYLSAVHGWFVRAVSWLNR
jgi:transcriptional regulator with XRE-family HTH domain